MNPVQPKRSIRDAVPLGAVAEPATRIAFYGAITLPIIYLPLLVTGIESIEGLAVFLGVFAVHVLTLIVGRPYRRS